MARVDLKCPCGHSFFVSDAQIHPEGTVECPACGAGVNPSAKAPAAKTPSRAAPTPFPGIEDASESKAPARKKLILIGGGVAAVIVIGVVILLVGSSSPKVDFEKQAALEVEKRKKAFEEVVSRSTPVAPVPPPKSSVGTETSPVKPSTTSSVKPLAKDPQPKPTPDTSPKPSKTPSPLNPDFSAKIRTEVLPLHSFYMGLVLSPTEQARMDGLLSNGTSGPEDVDFLQAIVTGGKLKAVRDEIGMISQTIPTLERESQEGLPVDKVTLNDGRVLNCRVIDEGPDIVKVSRSMTSGVGGQLPLRRDTITRIEKGKGVGADYAARWEAARKGSLASQVELLGWCKESGLPGQARLVAFSILRLDPSNSQARAEAGLPSDPVKNAEEVARGGVIVYQGRSWSPKELREKLQKDGYFLVDGQWYFKKERSFSVPGLFRYEKQADKPVLIGNNGMVCHDTETTYRSVQEPGTPNIVEQSEVRFLRRFYAPPMTIELAPTPPPGVTPPVTTFEQDVRMEYDKAAPAPGTVMKGEVPLFVSVGEPIFEASVMTTAEVKTGGSIVVYLITKSGEGEKRTKLYTCDPRENQSHSIPPDLIRGATEVSLVAVIEGTAGYTQKIERRHVRNIFREGKRVVLPALDVVHTRMIPDYKAMLFPSPATGGTDVFRLKAVTGEPAASLNKLFAANPDALK
jgi:hypothetical protein